jgi:hypothetical protein
MFGAHFESFYLCQHDRCLSCDLDVEDVLTSIKMQIDEALEMATLVSTAYL